MNKNPIKCEECGKFIKYDDLYNGAAIHKLKSYDTEYTYETYLSLCKKCNIKENK
ncbi:MAG TPA: hypothetical protein VNF93_02435 [Buchnera sp. (in: enterobacteria)]|nr:hypothetical protein [Buchnera sp. (in: enterobacteria)]